VQKQGSEDDIALRYPTSEDDIAHQVRPEEAFYYNNKLEVQTH
jgi:hypothetical protein